MSGASPVPAPTPDPAPPAPPATPPVEPGNPPEPAQKEPSSKVVPEQYADFKLPEGVTLDPEMLTEFKSAAKEAGLTQEAAQKFIELGAKITKGQTTRLQSEVNATREQWKTAAAADPEFGGEKFDANLAVAKKAFDQFGTPELKTFLNDTGLGNHPELVRWAFRVGGALSEDGIVKGRQGDGTSSDDLAAILYPTSINKAA